MTDCSRSPRDYRLDEQLPAAAGPAPETARWCLTTLCEKLVKIGARLTRHARRLVLQMTELAVTRDSFAQILSRISHIKPVPT